MVSFTLTQWGQIPSPQDLARYISYWHYVFKNFYSAIPSRPSWPRLDGGGSDELELTLTNSVFTTSLTCSNDGLMA